MKSQNPDSASTLRAAPTLWPRQERVLCWTVRIVTLLYGLALAYEPLYHLGRHSLLFYDFPVDDFYYYLLTAKNLALHGLSSFDGIVPTNGYHPLWLWLLTGVIWVVRETGPRFFIALELIQVVATVASGELVLRLFQALFPATRLRYGVTLLVISLQTILIFLSMETVLAIPFELLFALLTVRLFDKSSASVKTAALTGFVGAVLILSRLDSVIAVALAGIMLLFFEDDRRKLLYFGLGLSPVLLYLLSNKLFFGTWLTVSSEAKLLKDGWSIDPTILYLVRTIRGFTYLFLIFTGAAIALRRLMTRKEVPSMTNRRQARMMTMIVVLVFPVAYTFALSLRSSWTVYPWYFYPYPIAIGTSVLLIAEVFPSPLRRIGELLSIPVLGAVIVGVVLFTMRDVPRFTSDFEASHDSIFEHAIKLRDFARTHPGRYAMGDRAGLSAFFMERPVLQLEGLAADQAMVDSIKHEADLLAVLRRYGVDYYVDSQVIHDVPQKNGIWLPTEPKPEQCGDDSRRMRGHFSAPDVFDILPTPEDLKVAGSDLPHVCYTRVLDISRAVEAERGRMAGVVN